MPTKRRVFLFLIVLAVMLLIKRAVAQDAGGSVGWDSVTVCYGSPGSGLDEDVFNTMIAGIMFGALTGFTRATERHFAAVRGNYFSGDLVTLRIRS